MSRRAQEIAPSTGSSVAPEQVRRAPAVLTDRGRATVALLRFERAFEALAPADRASFAESLAQLAGAAGSARKVA
jgi:hypothetical protein